MYCNCDCDECNDGDHCGTIYCGYAASVLRAREPRCTLGITCCMTGPHFADECVSSEDMEEWMREDKVK